MERDNDHRLAEERSLALHREVARRLREDPALLAHARGNVERWRAQGTMAPAYAEEWRRVLDGSLDALLALLVDEGEPARALRQNSPFTFVVSPRDRRTIWRESRERWEAGP